MKKTLLIGMSKNYQKVELSMEYDTSLANEIELQDSLVKEARETLEQVLEQVETIGKEQLVEMIENKVDTPLKTYEVAIAPTPTPTIPQDKYQVANGTISVKQANVLIKKGLVPSSMTWQQCKEQLDLLFKKG